MSAKRHGLRLPSGAFACPYGVNTPLDDQNRLYPLATRGGLNVARHLQSPKTHSGTPC